MSGKMTVTFFAAGKADAVLIQTDSSSVMIDTGRQKNAVRLTEALKERNVTALNAVILSHYDKDHIGGASRILKKIPTEKVYGTYRLRKDDDIRRLDKTVIRQKIPFVISNRETTFSLDGAVYDIYPASGEYTGSQANNASLIVSVTFADIRFLFTGDAEDERIREFIEEYYIKTDILKIPYHGYPSRALEQLLAAARPSLCVITNSRRMPPARKISETRSMISNIGAECLETAEGTVTIVTDGREYEIIR